MILRVDRVGGRARVIIDEERVLQQGWTQVSLPVPRPERCPEIPEILEFVLNVLKF